MQCGLCQSTQPLLCPPLPLESCFLCDEEPADRLLALTAPRDAPAVQEKPLGALAVAQPGGLGWLRGTQHGELTQGTKGFMEHKQHFWMAVHSGEFIWIFCCLKKQSRGREAWMRGKGSALIKLTVLLMSLWTQPLSFPLPAATSVIRCRGRRGNVAAHSAAGSI